MEDHRFLKRVEALEASTLSLHRRWLTQLLLGFNILLYGYGSKRQICALFGRQLSHYHVIHFHGYHPDITIQKMISFIVKEIFKAGWTSQSVKEQIHFIEMQFSQEKAQDLFLFVHSLDALHLRSPRTQELLSKLASLPKVHLLATVDHLHALQLWNLSTRSDFNWCWYETTTFAPYKCETELLSSQPLEEKKTNVRATVTVLRSLSSKTQEIYKSLLEYYLTKKNDDELGLNKKKLLKICLDKFIVHGPEAFNLQLNEFLDHGIVATKKAKNGQDLVSIPLDSAQLIALTRELGWDHIIY
jgi:origin recognition complex subunit 2